MSIHNDRQRIIKAVHLVGRRKKEFTTADIVLAFRGKVSRQYVISVLKELIRHDILVKQGTTIGTTYALAQYASELFTTAKKRLSRHGLKEHEVLDDLNRQLRIKDAIRENVYSIFSYAFSEMLNNAIEHSKSAVVEVEVGHRQKKVTFIVRDFGIGVFRNVMKKRKLKSEIEAIQDLLKGKITTQPKAHSGEGIFFTSKVADIFILESFGLRLRIDNNIHDVFLEEVKPKTRGTKVTFVMADRSAKHLNQVFRKYQTTPSNYAFNKTEVKVRLYTIGTIYISRSQARRVLSGLEKFKLVILDFAKVPTIGQAFADEVFRVYKTKYPKITIQPIHMNEPVRFMVERVGK